MAQLGVNIDHVATVRQARRTYEPDPVWAAVLAELGGADGITIHLREDRRHIQDRDLRVLRETVNVKLNLELACADEVVQIACQTKPNQATLVPERREEVTTEGGLDVRGRQSQVADAIRRLHEAGIVVSLFLDADAEQIDLKRRNWGPMPSSYIRDSMHWPRQARNATCSSNTWSKGDDKSSMPAWCCMRVMD